MRATVMQRVAEELRVALHKCTTVQPEQEVVGKPYVSKKFTLLHTRKIQDYELNREMSQEEYNKKHSELNDKLQKLHNRIYK